MTVIKRSSPACSAAAFMLALLAAFATQGAEARSCYIDAYGRRRVRSLLLLIDPR